MHTEELMFCSFQSSACYTVRAALSGFVKTSFPAFFEEMCFLRPEKPFVSSISSCSLRLSKDGKRAGC